jgi:AraC-like DNA-binding protein
MVPVSDGREPAGERLEIVRPRELPGAEILRAERCGRLWKVLHETYTIATIRRGEGRWAYRAREYDLGAGRTSLMEPGEVHVMLSLDGPGDFRVLHLAPWVVGEAAAQFDLPAAPRLARPQCDDPVLFGAFDRLHRSLEQGGSSLESEELFASALERYLNTCMEGSRTASEERARHPAVRRAEQVLRERLAENHSLEELAREARLSRFYFLRAFKRAYGVPPHEYQLQLRVARARRLLLQGLSSVEVAADLGFSDQSHFTKQFRRIVGVTPGAYASAEGRAITSYTEPG